MNVQGSGQARPGQGRAGGLAAALTRIDDVHRVSRTCYGAQALNHLGYKARSCGRAVN